MEINDFREAASKVNFIGCRLQKVKVSIEAWAWPLATGVRPLHNSPRYTIIYFYGSMVNECTEVASGSGASLSEAITAAFAHWLEKEYGFVPAPTTPGIVQLRPNLKVNQQA